VAHPYELHVDVVAPCLCCRAPRGFRFASASDQVVCAACVNHLGEAKAQRRDTDHVAMWEALYAETTRAAATAAADAASAAERDAATIAGLRSQASGLTAVVAGEFAGADAPGVRELLETDVVRRAERNTELANRRTDRLMGALWRIDRLHHDDPATHGACSCGRPVATCPESLAIDSQRQAVRDWEARNVVLLQRGERHALDDSHPLVVQARSAAGRERPARR
jgi:hypothetical protein